MDTVAICRYQESFFDKLHSINNQRKLEIIQEYTDSEIIKRYGFKRFFISQDTKKSVFKEEKDFYYDNISCVDIPLIEKGVDFAIKYHRDQKRKSGEPYYSHPLAVAELVMEKKFETNIIIGALLHDTVEDTTLTLEDIEHEFNSEVAYMVESVTRVRDAVTGIKPTVWDKILESYLNNNHDALLIKLCDRLHNMETLHYMKPEKQKEIIDETIDAFASISISLNFNDMYNILLGLKSKNNFHPFWTQSDTFKFPFPVVKNDSHLVKQELR